LAVLYPYVPFFYHSSSHPLDLPSFPTRRSSDLLFCKNCRSLDKNKNTPNRPPMTMATVVEIPSIIKVSTNACIISLRSASSLSRSEEHTSELQSRFDLVCRLLLETKKAARCTSG